MLEYILDVVSQVVFIGTIICCVLMFNHFNPYLKLTIVIG
jgi:hypothetical protein